ncbi:MULTISPECIES: hypothetical protein [Shinella]|uniref:Uncharacterized protein n=1 Tax=Shinella granuli TaxID=323621 RepID=A0A4R2CCU3_SHIGR|nr:MULTISPECIES: hypothetical protein [Shinella]ANH08102.1 hypothetical protein shn_28655 [Shinella sp. HZN7]TCN36789.1 hypothetical protein EV665_12450 [Shinella granuli]
MMDNMAKQAVQDVMTMGPAVLMPQNIRFRRPIDVVDSPALSAPDKRTILAAWASDYYAVDSKPALRQIPGTPEAVSIDDVQSALQELDRRYDL